jgi:hypothetical protein
MAYILTREKNQQSELEMINAARHQRRKPVNAEAVRPSHISIGMLESIPETSATPSHGSPSKLLKAWTPEPKRSSFETALSPSLQIPESDIDRESKLDMKNGGANNGEPKQSRKFADS